MDEETREKTLENLTKGNAADTITRFKHGWEVNFPLIIMNNILLTQSPKGRVKKKMKQAAKEMRKVSKEQSRQAREYVEVGFL